MATVAFQPAALDQAVPNTFNFVSGGNLGRRGTSRTESSSRPTLQHSPVSESTVVGSLPDFSQSPTPKPPTDSESQPESACNEPPASVDALKIVINSPVDVNKLKYHRSNHYPSDTTKSSIKEIQPLQLNFDREIPLANWKEIRGGRPYFYDSNRALLTRTNLYDDYEDNLVHIETAANTLVQRRDAVWEHIPPDTEIVMCKTWDYTDEAYAIGYYLVSMAQQSIFWLPPQDGEGPIPVDLITEDLRYVVSLPHLGLSNEWQFWTHVELFPGHRPLSSTVITELIHTFNAGLCDAITSSNSMFPYDADTITHLAKTFESVTADEVNPHGSFIAGRLLARIYHERYLNFWGESGARLIHSEGAIADNDEKRLNLLVLKLLSPVLFFMPILYVQELQELYVDASVRYHPWQTFLTENLKRDWENSITPTTVLIATNIGFLSINSIDGNGGPNKSVAQILSYISTILAAFIYLVCQILQRHHRYHVGNRVQALELLQSRSLPTLAISFSIPTALFLWSMITFLAAMAVVFFDHTALATRVAMGVLLLLLLIVLGMLLCLESEGTIRSTFNSFGLAKRLWWNTSEWCSAHWPRFGRHAPADGTPSAEAEHDLDISSRPPDTSSLRRRSQIRRWLSRRRQPASDGPA
ncbi:hypothetical protein PsYK624_130810 [Phanerochaete sordida]|uniref:WW domain-containing protein n=1 Tax=Phanerochaete sordida TaxID=48140 RepID=A0A9P3GP07_9APHY|nr:hypothetical protein PsYK624_130810 [Phanerochaete sordida]